MKQEIILGTVRTRFDKFSEALSPLLVPKLSEAGIRSDGQGDAVLVEV